jgi:hypothetical protein
MEGEVVRREVQVLVQLRQAQVTWRGMLRPLLSSFCGEQQRHHLLATTRNTITTHLHGPRKHCPVRHSPSRKLQIRQLDPRDRALTRNTR